MKRDGQLKQYILANLPVPYNICVCYYLLLNEEVLVGAFNQEGEGPNRGLLCENFPDGSLAGLVVGGCHLEMVMTVTVRRSISSPSSWYACCSVDSSDWRPVKWRTSWAGRPLQGATKFWRNFHNIWRKRPLYCLHSHTHTQDSFKTLIAWNLYPCMQRNSLMVGF